MFFENSISNHPLIPRADDPADFPDLPGLTTFDRFDLSPFSDERFTATGPAYTSGPERAGAEKRRAARRRGSQAHITWDHQVVKFQSLDTLHLSVWADLSESDLLDKIEEYREMVREYEYEYFGFRYFEEGFNVHRSGRRYFTYHLSQGDIHIFFNRRKASDPRPTCVIEIGSISCWKPGGVAVFKGIQELFKRHNIKILRYKISRFDPCADFVGLNINDLEADVRSRKRWVCRARKMGNFDEGLKYSGLTLGKKGVSMRIYDKPLEMKGRRSTAKEKFFREEVWKDAESPVTRVEFELRREVINQIVLDEKLKLETVEDLENSLNAIWAYLTQEWARHSERAVDSKNKNQKHAKESKFWLLVQSVFFKKSLKRKLQRNKRKTNHINQEHLLKQGYGCMVKAVCCEIKTTDDLKKIPSIAKKILSKEIWRRINDDFANFENYVQTVINSNIITLNPRRHYG